MQRVKKHYIVIIVLSFIMALFLEALFICAKYVDVDYEIQDAHLLYPVSEYELSGYENTRNTFIPTNNDPMIVFNDINQNIECIYMEFSEPLASDIYFQIFYSTTEHGFSEEHSLRMTLEKGTTEIAVDTPYIICDDLRFDINGSFAITDISLSPRDFTRNLSFEKIEFSFARILVWLALTFLIIVLVYRYLIKNDNNRCITKSEFLYCIIVFTFYLIWAISKEFNYAPDEYMRYDVSLFFYQNNRLPAFEETINAYWGFSYAHLPAMLCNVLSYIPMKIVSLFSTDENMLLYAARMVSVLCATGIVLFSILTAKKLFNSYTKWIYVVFISFIPQFIFLSSYVNNDIVALFGASIIFYSWTMSLKETWSYKYLLLLSIGISVCTTSYYNSYGWILCSIIFYIASYFMTKGWSFKDFVRRSSFVCGIVIALSCYLFIRHYVLYNDLLGFEISDYYNQLYGQNSDSLSLSEQGISLFYMLFNMNWIETAYKSFIETFGYMSVYPAKHVYYIYTVVLVIGFISAIALFVNMIKNQSRHINKINLLYGFCIMLAIIIPVFLNVWNSYNTDFQPQGRYSYPALLGIAFIITEGFSFLIERIKKREYRYFCIGAFSAVLITIAVSEYFVTYLPS